MLCTSEKDTCLKMIPQTHAVTPRVCVGSVTFLECAFFGMCLFWNVPFLDVHLLYMISCSYLSRSLNSFWVQAALSNSSKGANNVPLENRLCDRGKSWRLSSAILIAPSSPGKKPSCFARAFASLLLVSSEICCRRRNCLKLRVFKSIQPTPLQTHHSCLHEKCRHGVCLYRSLLYRFKRP